MKRRDLAALALVLLPALAGAAAPVVYRIAPRDTDPSIKRYNEPHFVMLDPSAAASADLLVFLPGTEGRPERVSELLKVALTQGYRTVSLSYNNSPSVVSLCVRDPDPECSAKVRLKRSLGEDATSRIDDTRSESILSRLTMLLATLHRDHPAEGWGGYLQADGPRWERIALAGHSQGAGMTAFIAQRKRVARAILFSGPTDFYGPGSRLAPWILAGPGVTPAPAWYAAYHARENNAKLIALAYKSLTVPEANVVVHTLQPAWFITSDPYHLIVPDGTVPRASDGSPAYSGEWRFLLGHSR